MTTNNSQALSSSPLRDLINMACGRFEANISSERITQLAAGSILCALVLAAAWGAAAGSSSPSLAASSSIKVPLVILLSTLAALPASLLTLKLSGVNYRSSQLLASICSGVFGGTLVLASLAPIVGIYYHTSAEVGSSLAIGSVFLALLVGGFVTMRNGLKSRLEDVKATRIGLPIIVFMLVLLTAMLQFIALASPILPSSSAFDAGIDGFIQR